MSRTPERRATSRDALLTDVMRELATKARVEPTADALDLSRPTTAPKRTEPATGATLTDATFALGAL